MGPPLEVERAQPAGHHVKRRDERRPDAVGSRQEHGDLPIAAEEQCRLERVRRVEKGAGVAQPGEHAGCGSVAGQSGARAEIATGQTAQALGVVRTIEEFNPDKRLNPRSSKIARITFKDNGETDHVTLLWSGDTLINLTRYEALKMIIKKMEGTTYLFIEAGGFKANQKPGWKSQWYVLKR